MVGQFHDKETAALQVYDWKSQRGILLDTGIELEVRQLFFLSMRRNLVSL